MASWTRMAVAPILLGLTLSTFSTIAPQSASAATKRIKASTVAQMVNAGLDDAKIHLNNFGRYDEDIKNTWHRKNDSIFSWKGVTYRFDLDSDQCHGGRLDRCYYVSDVNSKQMDMAPKGNAFLLNIEFESKGSELKGMCRWKKLNGDYRPCTGNEDKRAPDINWLNNKLEVLLVPKARKGGVTFQVQNVEAKGEFQMNGICKIGSDICNRLFGYKRKIENGVEAAVKEQFNDARTQDKLASITRQGLSKLGVPAIKSLRMDDGDIVVEY